MQLVRPAAGPLAGPTQQVLFRQACPDHAMLLTTTTEKAMHADSAGASWASMPRPGQAAAARC